MYQSTLFTNVIIVSVIALWQIDRVVTKNFNLGKTR